jgi:ABC-type cobalamin/Fe3+-siderophores transport system ATPase subunit
MMVEYHVLPAGARLPVGARSTAYLLTDNWDDHFRFNTQYYLCYIDETGRELDLGHVKIGQFGMLDGQRRPAIPDYFQALGGAFFSLGQDVSYYEAIRDLGDALRHELMVGLCDISFNVDLFRRCLDEAVTGVSLLRSVSRSTVQRQYHRIATGGVSLDSYSFSYETPQPSKISINFYVKPESHPPSNVHVLIGRNGVGKTRLLQNMALALTDEDPAQQVGKFTEGDAGQLGSGRYESQFANMVSVSFSAFDDFRPVRIPQDRSTRLLYQYVGLKSLDGGISGPETKSPAALAQEFGESVRICLNGPRMARWRRSLGLLESDPIFKDANISALAETRADDNELVGYAHNVFSNLSSGHKIVLLTVTKLVETVEERSLVLLDEPEAHLHPPLLSAFIRSLSALLIDRNGVAIIATHSPVVLQEVPRDCVTVMHRSGRAVSVERPEIETFGENVGVLTREIFGLEVTDSGFHRMLRELVDDGRSYEDVVALFDGKLGGEAKAIVRSLVAVKPWWLSR